MIHTLIHQFGVFAWGIKAETEKEQETNKERGEDRETETGVGGL